MHKVNTFLKNNSFLLHFYSKRCFQSVFLCTSHIFWRFFDFLKDFRTLKSKYIRALSVIFYGNKMNIFFLTAYLCTFSEYIQASIIFPSGGDVTIDIIPKK